MPKDLDRMQGAWAVESLELDAKQMPSMMLSEARVVIKGNRFSNTGMGAVYQGTIELDDSHQPAHIDMRFDDGPEKGNTNRGIYRFDGDRLVLCLATRGGERPSSFATSPGTGFALETLARFAGAGAETLIAASVKPASHATELEGEWHMVSGVFDGLEMEKSAAQWVRRVTHGHLTTVYAGPQIVMKAEFTLDSSRSPATIDYLNLAGSNKGKTQLAIYELRGDVLKVCLAAPGAPRPTEFNSAAGDGRVLTVWSRA